MSNNGFDEVKRLRIEARIIRQMSLATIRNFSDAIVELLTNCDDSYRRLEDKHVDCSGEIKIYIKRLKGGKCEELKAVDFAEGMEKNQLEEALKFGGETSGIEKGKSVRGLFGRGMKESIFALGKGSIYTIKDDKISIAELWWDESDRNAKYKIIKESYTPSIKERENIGILSGNGTCISISITNEKIRCPDYKTLKPQICSHFALRDINASKKRKVDLSFEAENGLKTSVNILYENPKGKIIIEESVTLPNYGDEVKIWVFESEIELDSPYNDPYSKAGLLIKSGGAILDKKLFKFETEKAGCYFFGEVICEGIYNKVKGGDYGIIDPNRCGIEWQHQYCKILQNEIENILQPLIEKKREEIQKSKPSAKMSEHTKKMLGKICQLLNRFAKLELEKEAPDGTDLEEGDEIKKMIIKPSRAHIVVNKERWFSLYIPFQQVGVIPKVKVSSVNNEKISVLDPEISNFHSHSKKPEILMGRFRVIGREIGAIGKITCTSENGDTATTEVDVVPGEKGGGKKKRKLVLPKGGFFTDIIPDLENEPAQRVAYESSTGKIKVFVKFPMVQQYLDEKLESKRNEGKAILAELISEAFCRWIARERVEGGKTPVFTSEIDAYNVAMNAVQKEYLHQIHKILTE